MKFSMTGQEKCDILIHVTVHLKRSCWMSSEQFFSYLMAWRCYISIW